jgi:hypothetical protein
MPLDLPPHKLWLPPKPAIIRALSREELKLGFLPGFIPPGAGAASRLTTLTNVLSSTDSSGAAFTLPTGIIAGDLIIVLDCADSDASISAPTGFTTIVSAAVGGMDMVLSYKLAVGTESGASVNGLDGSFGEGKIVEVFRGNVPIKTVTPADTANEGTDNNPSAQTVNASGGTPPLIVFGGYESFDGSVNPRTFTVAGSPAKDDEQQLSGFGTGSGAIDLWLAWKIYNTNPADVVVDMDDEGNDMMLLSCYIACS